MKSLPVRHFLPPPAQRDAKFLTVRNLLTTIPTGLICRSAVQPVEHLPKNFLRFPGHGLNMDETRNGEGERPREALTSPGSLRIPKDGAREDARPPARKKSVFNPWLILDIAAGYYYGLGFCHRRSRALSADKFETSRTTLGRSSKTCSSAGIVPQAVTIKTSTGLGKSIPSSRFRRSKRRRSIFAHSAR